MNAAASKNAERDDGSISQSITEPLSIGGTAAVTIDDVGALADGRAVPRIADEAMKRMGASAAMVAKLHARGDAIYGVTTSVGHSVTTAVPPELSAELSLNLLRMHGCGTGRLLDPRESSAVVAIRLISLCQGLSGVRPVVAERLAVMLREGVLPVIPSEGSVGASGDLTPLSYVAAALVGEREVYVDGAVTAAAKGIASLGLEPLTLGPKEALVLMNGTAVATAISCLAWLRARRVARAASFVAAMASRAIGGNPSHFDAFLHRAKPHAGQALTAAWIARDLDYDSANPDRGERLQDRYSIRCVPHVVGVLVDALTISRQMLETELNGVSDNPIVDVEREMICHGGNFYGGHVAFAADSLKAAVASVADLLDRQMQVLCSTTENGGLPANLVGVTGPSACAHNGFKAVTIATSALAAEALKLTMPASAFSRSTELHNQDKVPMATLAARDLDRVVTITEQVVAMLLLASAQAMELRGGDVPANIATMMTAIRERVPPLEADRRMDGDIAAIVSAMRDGALPFGDETLRYRAEAAAT